VRHALLAGWVAFIVLSWAASPAHFWLDSGEIGAAGYELGVIHPPGAPGYALLLRAATLLPLGSIGFRMAVLSSALAALSVGLVFEILDRRGADKVTCWAAAAWVLAGWTFARHGRVVEIYALSAALFLVVLWGFDAVGPSVTRTGRRLLATFAAVWAALCFGDLRLALVLPVIVGWVVAMRRGRPWARWAPVTVAWACCTALTLPLSSVRGPRADWGDPDTASALYDHVMASSIRNAYADEILPSSTAMWWHNFEAFAAQLAEDLGPLGPVAIGLALVMLWLRWADGPAARRVAAGLLWLVGIEVFYAVAINPMGIRDRQTGLLLAPLGALAIGEALRRALTGRRRLRWAVVPLTWVTLVLPAALASWHDLRATRAWTPQAWTRAVVAELPPRSLLLMQSDDLAAGVAYAKIVEGTRPDVVAVVGQHLYKPPTEAVQASPVESKVWAAAARGTTEAERVEAAAAAYPGPVAIEHAATAIFKGVRLWSDAGRIPLRLLGVRPPATRRPPAEQAREFIDYWQPRWQTLEDRERVAVALTNFARGLVRATGDIDGAQAVLEGVLSRVWADHASTLVTLGAIRDRLGDTPEAIRLTRRALELEPDRAAALTNLALYLGREPTTRPEAMALAERATQLRPWRADGWARLAALREAAGDEKGAASARERAGAAVR
jgi:tetratricopeptide (TPR) repeat protein